MPARDPQQRAAIAERARAAYRNHIRDELIQAGHSPDEAAGLIDTVISTRRTGAGHKGAAIARQRAADYRAMVEHRDDTLAALDAHLNAIEDIRDRVNDLRTAVANLGGPR
ncbi:MAG TPA: hypothetical protein VFX60_19155 [Micromonospora sp.]|nr:hypothetical protein [Micromonospora sp.]